jgi:Cu+-exporting ATPase
METNEHTITLKIEGMDCNNCALGIARTIEKRGLKNVNVNFATGEAAFNLDNSNLLKDIISDIHKLGYKVIENADLQNEGKFSSVEKKFIFCLIFTLPLFMHMFLPFAVLHNKYVQLFLCLPVAAVGLHHFGRSALGSVKAGVPNMDVLIFIGSLSALVYSISGTFFYADDVHNYLFYETAATIITLVLLGNVLEHRSVKQTTTAISELSKLQKTTAKKVISENETIEIEADKLKPGDLVLVNTGDKIPADGFIFSGDALVNEAMITGETLPVSKTNGNKVTGGTIVTDGSIKLIAERTGKNTTLSQIIDLVKKAQNTKPAIQMLGDKIAAVFVPAVLLIALITFIIWFYVLNSNLQTAIMNSIAVLVISCPCAMGLATPTAIIAGIGRAAKNGILIKGGSTLEEFAKIKNIAFDKTGTITTGDFKIAALNIAEGENLAEIKNYLFAAENYSSHPIAKSLVRELANQITAKPTITDVQELKGKGIVFKDKAGIQWKVGSKHLIETDKVADVYITKNNLLVAWLTIADEIKQNSQMCVNYFNELKITTHLLSGDKKEKCELAASRTGIKNIIAEKSPEEKLKSVTKIKQTGKIAMLGDGINDAPALAAADVSISIANATDVAIQQAQIVLLNKSDLAQLVLSHQISKHTLLTVKQNLFWAFFYNIIAIPVAACGLLNPMVGALTMAFSDVIVIGNSIRLKTKKIN